jgi:riboflavin kinase/FMN adenylyltransferase
LQAFSDALRSHDLPCPSVVTIGNYDGIHLGQRDLLERTVARARDLGLPAVVVTFDPHPLKVLSPDSAPLAITTRRQKERLLAAIGVDALASVAFNHEVAEMPAEAFVRSFLLARLGAREILVGRRFAFGRGREGNLALLEMLGPELGFGTTGVEELLVDGEPVSSSRIRRAIAEGRVEVATRLLGRPFPLEGQIVAGDRMGSKLGWPTINLSPEGELFPMEGVYATRVHFPSFPATFDSVTNIGTRPTVYENHQRVIESHVLDFRSDVYGERIELSFHKRLRDEMLFPSVMALSAQIRRDVESTREYFFDAARS